jgi:hypothetical protein
MKVALFSKYLRMGASSRLRSLPFLPALGQPMDRHYPLRPDWQTLIDTNADRFSELSAIQERRADLYEQEGLFGRLRLYGEIWFKGDYLMPGFTRMGLLNAVKDVPRKLRGAASRSRR